jgi:hypothetical protein
MMRTLLCTLLLLTLQGWSQTDDYVNDNVMHYDEHIYRPTIRTVQFHQTTWEYAQPVIALNSNDQLELAFDDLDGDQKQYSISFVHCNADWTPSDLMVSEYLNGYYDINIINFAYSINTFQSYTHYSIVFPQNNNVRFTKSGNYVLYVYKFGDKKDLVLTRRFMVYEDKVKVGATFRQTIAGDDQYNKQQLDFNINTGTYNLTDPYKDMKVALIQNNRWENAVTDIKPTFINASQLVYSLDEKSTFNGGNEFRYFDTRSLRFLTERVKHIYRDSAMMYHALIYPDESRRNKPYFYYNDLNGAFFIKNSESFGNPDTDADYVMVHFFLPYKTPEAKGNFYVLGKLTDWRMNSTNRMTYNYEKEGYELSLFLKQGYYNYIYVLSDDTKKGGDETIVEGNHWDTENYYTICVYHRKFGTYYDQLIAYKVLNTLRKQ